MAARLDILLAGTLAVCRPSRLLATACPLDQYKAASRPNIATIISKGGGYVDKNRNFLIVARRVYYLVFLLFFFFLLALHIAKLEMVKRETEISSR